MISEKADVTAFVVRRFVDRGLLVDLSANPDGTPHHPGQVDQGCRREDLADLVAADMPLGADPLGDPRRHPRNLPHPGMCTDLPATSALTLSTRLASWTR
ncbi:hypothetical protein ABZ760_12610 [Streptomyces sp. NPDC006658]|uniref:hypothetical protein n=1 Tax=Streptomyces sp. NPDC006658 TaxID=3156900 RepID=UPI0033F0AD77